MMGFSIRRDKGDIFQSLIISLFEGWVVSHVVEGILIPILPNRPKAKGEDIMLSEHFIKTFVFQH